MGQLDAFWANLTPSSLKGSFLELEPDFLDLIHNDSCPGSDELWQVAERVLVGPAPGDLELFRAGREWPRAVTSLACAPVCFV